MDDPTGKDGAIRLLFVDIAHEPGDCCGEQDEQNGFSNACRPQKQSAVQKAEQKRLCDICRHEPKLRLHALEQKAAEQQFFGERGIQQGPPVSLCRKIQKRRSLCPGTQKEAPAQTL